MPRPRPKPNRGTQKPKALGKQGKRVRSEIIKGHEAEIAKLKAELKKTKDPIQKDLLAKQIRLEGLNLAEFKRKTQ